ncbi:YbaK/prolyl-tRNA synthetase associated domain-containing protein, partial [Streptomyces tricolor]
GQTARAGVLRGHPLAAAATRRVVIVVGGPAAGERQVLSVVPGDRRVDFARVAREWAEPGRGSPGARPRRRSPAA